MVTASMGARVVVAVGLEHFLIAPPQESEISLRGAQGSQPCRLAFQQRAHLQQVVERARLGAEQVHQRRDIAGTVQRGDERATALFGIDDAAPTQHAQALAQRRTRAAEFLHQAPFGGQHLPHLQHAIDDQAFDAFGDLIGHLALDLPDLSTHIAPNW
ncbi:hypothetical protein D3C78_1427340 [compost metagenome]